MFSWVLLLSPGGRLRFQSGRGCLLQSNGVEGTKAAKGWARNLGFVVGAEASCRRQASTSSLGCHWGQRCSARNLGRRIAMESTTRQRQQERRRRDDECDSVGLGLEMLTKRRAARRSDEKTDRQEEGNSKKKRSALGEGWRRRCVLDRWAGGNRGEKKKRREESGGRCQFHNLATIFLAFPAC